MGQFSVKTSTPPGSILNATQQTKPDYTNVVHLNVARIDDGPVVVAEALKTGGGGGNSGGMASDWKESVDRQLTQLHVDVRHLLLGCIGAVVLIVGAGWAGYVKLSDQIAEFRISQAQSSEKLSAIDERLKQSDEKLDRIVDKLDASKAR